MTASDEPVVICGAGVIGCAIAYELSARGRPVVVLEAERVAFGASGTAAGLLSPPDADDLDSPIGPMLESSFERHLQLATRLPAESGVDYAFARHPQFRIACTAAEERGLREWLAGPEAPSGARWVEPTALREALPWVDSDEGERPIRGAVLSGLGAQIEPDRFTQALLAAAQKNGAELRVGRVQGIDAGDGHATGVTVDGKTLAASAVVVAMGPWSTDAATWLGIPVPVEPLKGQILRLDPGDSFPLGGFTNADDDYATVKASGLIYLGTTEESAGFDRRPTGAARESILCFGRRHSLLITESRLVKQTACLRPLSADGLPIIGRVPGLSNVVLATGHGRKGLMLAPATGLAVAEVLTDGAADSVDLRPFAPDRFAG